MPCHRVLAGLGVAAGITIWIAPTAAFRPNQTQSTLRARAALPGPRFVVTANPGTVVKGTASSIAVGLRTSAGAEMTASADTPVTVTITTLATLDAAKRDAASAPPAVAAPTTLAQRRVAFPAGVRTQQVRAIFPKGLGRVTFSLIPNTVGLIRVFIEATGVEASSTIIAVSNRSEAGPQPERDERAVQLASFRQNSSSLHLVISDSGKDVLRREGELEQSFFVSLATEADPIARAPVDLIVDLRVDSGRAHFEPRVLRIPAHEAVSPEAAQLRSGLGGKVELAAGTAHPGIAVGRLNYIFEPGRRATQLVIEPLVPSALANGLDEIPITVKAIYAAEGPSTEVTAEQEALDSRRVTFQFTNGSARLRGGGSELVMSKSESRSTAYIVATSPSKALHIVATAANGLSEEVRGEAVVAFRLPWLQLLVAAVGGVVFPIFQKRRRSRAIAIGMTGGALFYVLMLFGALTTSAFQLGSFAVTLTKLPTENLLAAAALGALGGWALSPVFAKPSAKR